MKRVSKLLVFSFALVLFGCGDTTQKENTKADGNASKYAGYWASSEWGEMLLRVTDDGRLRGTYNHDKGTLIASMDGERKATGWWCEAPSREAADDNAGDLIFEFSTSSEPDTIDGRWRHGQQEAWREDWDLERKSEGDPPQNLIDRFEDDSAFCEKP